MKRLLLHRPSSPPFSLRGLQPCPCMPCIDCSIWYYLFWNSLDVPCDLSFTKKETYGCSPVIQIVAKFAVLFFAMSLPSPSLPIAVFQHVLSFESGIAVFCSCARAPQNSASTGCRIIFFAHDLDNAWEGTFPYTQATLAWFMGPEPPNVFAAKILQYRGRVTRRKPYYGRRKTRQWGGREHGIIPTDHIIFLPSA